MLIHSGAVYEWPSFSQDWLLLLKENILEEGYLCLAAYRRQKSKHCVNVQETAAVYNIPTLFGAAALGRKKGRKEGCKLIFSVHTNKICW